MCFTLRLHMSAAPPRVGLTQALARMNNDSAVHQIECTCYGSNPNCFKCGGWGYIDSVSANRLIDGPSGEAGKNGSVVSPKSSKSRKRRNDISVTPRQKKLRAVNFSTPTSGGSVLCKCGARVANSYYRSHLALSCKANKKSARKTVKRASKKSGRKTVKRASGTVRRDVKFKGSVNSPNLDATKDYAHAFRDRGSFGSHPSHDAFDDESSS